MNKLFDLPKVSFIVVCHNFEDYILECLKSIKNQSYKNTEIIIVDDVSTDKSHEIIEEFAKKNGAVFIKNPRNIGQLASFLEGLKYANGEFVCQIDGDDVLFEDYALVHVDTHLNANVAMTSSGQIEIDEKDVIHSFNSAESSQNIEETIELEEKNYKELQEYCYLKAKKVSGYSVKVLQREKYNFATWHWSPATSAMLRKSVCEMLLLLKNPEEIKITADKFIFSFAHLIGSSALIDKPLYAYRRHKSNYSLANPVMGSHRYLKTKTQNNYIRNNMLIRQAMFSFIVDNYSYFCEKLNKANVRYLIKKIVFSIDFTTLKSAIKSLFM